MKSYPHDKWVSTYLTTTRFGSFYIEKIKEYMDSFPRSNEVTVHLELEQYPCYVLGPTQLLKYFQKYLGFLTEITLRLASIIYRDKKGEFRK